MVWSLSQNGSGIYQLPLVLVYSRLYDLQKQIVFARETRFIVALPSLEDAISNMLQDWVLNLELVWTGNQLIVLVSSLSESLLGSGQAGEVGQDMCRSTWEIEAHLTADSPPEG